MPWGDNPVPGEGVEVEARGQSRGWSAVEALANVALGLAVSFAANLVLLPAFGLAVSLGQAAGISAAFTAVSLARSYLVRRLFNRLGRQ